MAAWRRLSCAARGAWRGERFFSCPGLRGGKRETMEATLLFFFLGEEHGWESSGDYIYLASLFEQGLSVFRKAS